MKHLWFVGALLLTTGLCAQSPSEPDTIFLSRYFDVVAPEEAYLFRVFEEQEKGVLETTYYIESGKVEAIRIYADANKEVYTGIWRTFYPDGTPKWETNYDEEAEELGLIKTWYENGQMKTREMFRDGVNIGKWEGWYENGNRKFLTTFSPEGILTEVGNSWYPDGALATSWNYAEGKLIVEGFYPDGSLQFKALGKNEAGIILAEAWDTDGNQAIRKGKGSWTWKDPAGTLLAEGTYKSGIPHGNWKFYHLGKEDASPVQYEGKMEKGSPVGKWKVYNWEGEYLMEVDVYQLDPAIMPRLKHTGPHPMEIAPRPLNMNEVKEAIGYPKKARDAGIEGQVIVRILISKGGVVKKVKVIQEVHPMLMEAIEPRLWDLRFTSAIQNGASLPFWVNIPFSFKLVE